MECVLWSDRFWVDRRVSTPVSTCMYVWCVKGTHVCVMCEGYTCMCGVWRVHMYV